MQYKIGETYSFFDSLKQSKKALLNYSDNKEEENLLNPQILQSFLDVLPNYIQFLNESESLDDENVTMSIASFNNFVQYNPKVKIAQVIIDSNAIDSLVKYGSNDIINNFSNPIFRDNILKVFNIFVEMSKSNDETIILKMIQKGVLTLCVNNCFIIDDEFNKNLSMILDIFIINSFFSRSLVYSTGILQNFLNNAIESSDEIPLSMIQFISGVTKTLILLSPTAGSKSLESSNTKESIDECNRLWDNFMENYYGNVIFIKDYYDDYVSNGIIFSEGNPVFDILKNLLVQTDYITLLNTLKSIYYLVSRDSHDKSGNKICGDIIYGRIPFLSYFSDYIETKKLKIIKYALKILTNAIYPKSFRYNDTDLNDLASIIINYLIGIEISNKENDQDFTLCCKIKKQSNVIAFAAQALLNILIIVDDFEYINDEIKCEKFLSFIYQCLRDGSYKVKKSFLFFYLTLVCGYLKNPQVYTSFQHNMAEISMIAKDNPNAYLNLHIIECLEYIFDNEESITGRTLLLDQFASPAINGFQMMYDFKNDESDPILAERAEKFIDKIYDFYEVENIPYNEENQIEFRQEQGNKEEEFDPSDLFYKGK